MISKILRRTHMYAALFLMPWILMYGISTVTMNHRFTRGPATWIKEREQTFGGQFSAQTSPQVMAEEILRELNLQGAFNANMNKTRLVVNRRDAVTPRRITYTPADGKLVIEKQQLGPVSVLEGLHHRRGYRVPFAVDKAWAVSVDATIAAIVLWVLSGLWMWWELKVTRRIGAICFAASVALFAVLVVMI